MTTDAHHAVGQPRAFPRVRPIDPRSIDILAFALPALSFIEIQLVGRLIATELVMLLLLPWLWHDRNRIALPRWLLLAWAAWAISQVVTDLVVGSQFADLSRGWARIAFTLSNLLAVAVLASSTTRARLYGLGLAFGTLTGMLIDPTVLQAGDPWKFGIAAPSGLALAAVLSDERLFRRAWVAPVALAAFGVLTVVLGFRSLGAIALVTSGFLATGTWWARRDRGVRSARRVIVLVALVAAATGTIFVGYSFAASRGLLGQQAQEKYLSQAGAFGLLVGGRLEILGSSQAIIDSPFLGHGSWAKDPRYAILMNQRGEALGYPPLNLYADGLIPTHSYVFGAWVEAGLLGAVFWFAVAILAVRALLGLLARRLSLAPLAALSVFQLLWDIPFSPYAGGARLDAPFAIMLCLLVVRLAVTGEPARGALPPLQTEPVP